MPPYELLLVRLHVFKLLLVWLLFRLLVRLLVMLLIVRFLLVGLLVLGQLHITLMLIVGVYGVGGTRIFLLVALP